MSYTMDTLNKLKQRFSQEDSGVGTTGVSGGVGAEARDRAKSFVGLGQRAAGQTEKGIQQGLDMQISTPTSTEERDIEGEMAEWIQLIQESSVENKKQYPEPQQQEMPAFTLPKDLYGKKGVQSGSVASHSYFNTPIIEGGLRGNSRKAGDVSPEVQSQIVEKIIDTGSKAGMSDEEIALTLAIARFESGFNPDASAKSSSASGIGQFINDTGLSYGISNETRWDADSQIQALVDHTLDNIAAAEKKGLGTEYVYALHHDGPSLNRGGLGLSKKEVMPFVSKYLSVIDSYRGE